MELSNTTKLWKMAEGAKIRILRSGIYVWKCLASTQWSITVTPAAICQLLSLPLLPLGTVNEAHTSLQQQQYMFRSLVMYFTSWVVATLLADQHLPYSTARGKSKQAHHVYQGKHPWRHLPHHTTFISTDIWIWASGTLQVRKYFCVHFHC